ncbi:hypothetical protein Glove_37g70 [Diversispora epigaea]|uniref:Uncharacterized protein n=1 Tax=Diversispora epigaea TaxID=1348612 RepID=A0A397JQ64_9GLOM|nr:hypothetical protein Glove_37g70 [Diversispora epigaea]
MDYILLCIILNSIGIFFSVISTAYIIFRAFKSFNCLMHLTCFSGSIIIVALNILDFLRSLGVIERFNNDLLCLHFIGTSMTAILSCYVLLQVGTNFYQEYNIVKTILIYAPIIVTFGVFGFSVFTAIQLVLNELTKPHYIFEKITLGFSLLAAFLTFLYTVFPLYNIRKQTKLQPERTAVSIIHLIFVILFFIAHFTVYCLFIIHGRLLDMKFSAILRLILLLIFPGCLIQPPRILVKKIKRKILGVEEMIIGGDYRPDMLPKDYEDTIPGPKILHPLVITKPIINPETVNIFNKNSNSPKVMNNNQNNNKNNESNDNKNNISPPPLPPPKDEGYKPLQSTNVVYNIGTPPPINTKYWKPPPKRSNTTPTNSIFGNGRVSARPPQPPKRSYTTPLRK